MFQKLFNPDNPLMITMAQISDVIFLSLFWLICCFPVVTIGASTAALYDSTYHAFRKGDRHAWGRFFRVFRAELKNGLLPTLVFLTVFCGGVWVLIQIWNAVAVGEMSAVVLAALAFVAVLILGMLSILFPMLSRFKNTTVALLKNIILLGFVNLPRTLCLGFLTAVCVFLCAWYVIPVFCVPCVGSLIATLLLEPMFKPYMPAENEESAV